MHDSGAGADRRLRPARRNGRRISRCEPLDRTVDIRRARGLQVNETHAEMTAKGWKFAGLSVYDEDGDMQGAFVTYTR